MPMVLFLRYQALVEVAAISLTTACSATARPTSNRIFGSFRTLHDGQNAARTKDQHARHAPKNSSHDLYFPAS
ncbi:hypothetical protein M404DRAFT_31384 [Pisolithus tinctorius Marx 270]|uniref:HAT C-terminal dimerisation domain-containing protein n=1 Tax=Pisolithus tinctorius Marx 270 TaxID=870435 RepID=A0A0C3JLE0_PISTI|nr:hypothetical protein M404DRAFT_31384 [Pisolithus tinctorius Marx 270]